MDPQHFRHLTIYLSNLLDGSADWAAIAEERGVSNKGNAARDFKAMMKRYGIEYAQNKFKVAAGVDATTSIPSTPTKGKNSSYSKKRKAETVNDFDKDTKPAKPKKYKNQEAAEDAEDGSETKEEAV